MTDLVLFLLATYGLTALLIEGKPTAPIRWLMAKIMPDGKHFIGCYLCMGLWCAVFCFICIKVEVLRPVLWTAAGSGVAYMIHNIAPEREEVNRHGTEV